MKCSGLYVPKQTRNSSKAFLHLLVSMSSATSSLSGPGPILVTWMPLVGSSVKLVHVGLVPVGRKASHSGNWRQKDLWFMSQVRKASLVTEPFNL